MAEHPGHFWICFWLALLFIQSSCVMSELECIRKGDRGCQGKVDHTK